jgi:hypothetical protein
MLIRVNLEMMLRMTWVFWIQMAMTLNLVPFLVLADSSFLDALFMILLLHLTYYNTNQIIMLFPDSTSVELGTLNDALQELLDGIQVALQE